MSTLQVLVVFAAALFMGGCIGSSDGASAGSSGSSPAQPTADPNSDMGVVTGTVTSDEAVAIAGAVVGLRNTNFTGVSDEQGLFGISNVPPGKYSMDIAKLGYESAARSLEVKQGQATNVVIQLRALTVANDTYPSTRHFGGLLECAMGSNVWVSSCSWPYTAVVLGLRDGFCDPVSGSTCTPAPGINLTQYGVPKDIQNNDFRFNFTAPVGVMEVISEAQWVPSSAAATTMQLSVHCGKYDPVNDQCAPRYSPVNGVAGKSPLRFDIDAAQLKTHRASEKVPAGAPLWMCSRLDLPFANPQVALSQKFDLWDTVFYNGVAPEGWTIIPSSG